MRAALAIPPSALLAPPLDPHLEPPFAADCPKYLSLKLIISSCLPTSSSTLAWQSKQLPKTEQLISRRFLTICSTTILLSYCRASSTPAMNSSSLWAIVIPTEDPKHAGFMTTG